MEDFTAQQTRMIRYALREHVASCRKAARSGKWAGQQFKGIRQNFRDEAEAYEKLAADLRLA